MSQVKIKVGPRQYTINCGPGDEDKVAALGAIIDEKYGQLGSTRAVQETDNLVFAALFLADELDEARKGSSEAVKQAETLKAEADDALERAEKIKQSASASVEHEKEKSGGKKAELRAEIETLRKAEERAREENAKLKAELADLREASRHQHDLFGAEASDDALISKLEKLADRAEQTAKALEQTNLEGGAAPA